METASIKAEHNLKKNKKNKKNKKTSGKKKKNSKKKKKTQPLQAKLEDKKHLHDKLEDEEIDLYTKHLQDQLKNKPLPDQLEDKLKYVTVGKKNVINPTGIYAADAFQSMGYDNSLVLSQFKEKFKIQIYSLTKDDIVFDMSGVDVPIANALRRIAMVEVPTMAIEKVTIFQNTSIMQDEVLAHRLGLIPIYADPDFFEYVSESNGQYNEKNTTVFTLEIKCTHNKDAPKEAVTTVRYNNSMVYSSDLKWVPQGQQATRFKSNPIRPVLDDILIVKLRPGQTIEAELWVEKGIGQTHAKWSPVGTASYRQMPKIILNEEILNDDAEQLVKMCPMDVFDIEDLAGKNQSAQKRAVVARPRNCSMCKECIRLDGWDKRIQLKRIRDHFIFSIESIGQYPPEVIFKEAVDILIKKLDKVMKLMHQDVRIDDD